MTKAINSGAIVRRLAQCAHRFMCPGAVHQVALGPCLHRGGG
jgi:hypothetical protein